MTRKNNVATVPKIPKPIKPTDTKPVKQSSGMKRDNLVYIRYRHRKPPVREEVRLLHPGIIDVRYPRQKSAKFCHLEFESKEAAIKAVQKMKKDHEKEIIIQYMKPEPPSNPTKTPEKSKPENPGDATPTKKVTNAVKNKKETEKSMPKNPEDKTRSDDTTSPAKKKAISKTMAQTSDVQQPTTCLHVSGLPDLAIKEVLQNLYSTNTSIEVIDKKIKGKRCALVHFKSEEDSSQAMESTKDVCVNGDMLTVRFHSK